MYIRLRKYQKFVMICLITITIIVSHGRLEFHLLICGKHNGKHFVYMPGGKNEPNENH